MSKKMSCAYWALRMKDACGYFATVVLKIAVVCFAIALSLVQTEMFSVATIVASCVAIVACVLILCASLCNLRMHSLGFTEVELERWGLA